MTLTKIFKSITRPEWLFVILLSLAVIFLTTATLVYGYLVTPAGQVFTGIHFTAPNDWFVYYSYMAQASPGKILFNDLFASEPHAPALNIPWLAVGLIAKFSSLPLPLVFNLARIFLIPIFYFLAYLFIAYLFQDLNKRKISLLLLSFASGLGVFLLDRLIRYPYNFHEGVFLWPMDLWVPESITFATMHYSPHLIFSLILLIFILFLSVLYIENKKFSYSIMAGVSGFVLFSFHPFHVLSVFAVISASFLVLMIKEKKILWYLVRYYLVFNLLSTPAILYYFYLLKVDPVWSQKALQNLTFITPLWITLFSYGLLLVFAVVGAYLLIKQKNTSAKFIFIISWAAAQFLVLYSPVNFQRRMTEGLHFPLVILTAVALFFIYSQIKQQNTALKKFLFSQRYAVLMILVVLFTASNFFLLAVDGYIYFSRREMSYIDKSYIEAAEWLKKVPADAIIFNSSRTFVNPVPAYSGRTVYVGHGVETPFFRQKENEVKWFFNRNRSEDIELVFLKKRNIDYIFYTPAERALGDYQPENKSYLNEVFGNQAVKIYAVLSSENL